MIRFIKITLRCVIGMILAMSVVNADSNGHCVRHIANNSNLPWVFTFKPHCEKGGNVYFINTSCAINGPCIIKPHSYLEIEYICAKGDLRGQVSIKDENQVEHVFNYKNRLWNECPRIDHKGATGSVSLNDPANGDFNIDADVW